MSDFDSRLQEEDQEQDGEDEEDDGERQEQEEHEEEQEDKQLETAPEYVRPRVLNDKWSSDSGEALSSSSALILVWTARERALLNVSSASGSGGGGADGASPVPERMRRKALLHFSKTGWDCFFKASVLFDAYCLHAGGVTPQAFDGICKVIPRIVAKMDSGAWRCEWEMCPELMDYEMTVLKTLKWQLLIPSIACWTSLYFMRLDLHLSEMDSQLRLPDSATKYAHSLSWVLVQELPASSRNPLHLTAAGVVCIALAACGALPAEALGLPQDLDSAWRSVLLAPGGLQQALRASVGPRAEDTSTTVAVVASGAVPSPAPQALVARGREVMEVVEASTQLKEEQLHTACNLAASAVLATVHRAASRRQRRQQQRQQHSAAGSSGSPPVPAPVAAA